MWPKAAGLTGDGGAGGGEGGICDSLRRTLAKRQGMVWRGRIADRSSLPASIPSRGKASPRRYMGYDTARLVLEPV